MALSPLMDLILEAHARPLGERQAGKPTLALSRSGPLADAYQAIRCRRISAQSSASLTRGCRGGKMVLVDAEHAHLPVQSGTRYAKPRGCGELVPTGLDQRLHHDVALGTLQQ